jgi:hypothetical protein
MGFETGKSFGMSKSSTQMFMNIFSFDAAEDRTAFYKEMVAFGAEVRARAPKRRH